jgi:HK97 gp10 family phage protein
MSIKIEGLNDVLESIKVAADTSELIGPMTKATLLVERTARQNAQSRSRTGELARSIGSKVEVEGNEVIGTIYATADYAPYVEYGTGLFAEGGNGRTDVPWYIHIGYGSNDITPEAAANMPIVTGSNGEQFAMSWGRHPAPFLRPALNVNREQIIRLLEGAGND